MYDHILILDKPPGITSHEICAYIRRIFKAHRAGHAGTLDPEVSGVLPIALDRATKLLRYIIAKKKRYVGIIKFKKPQTKAAVERLFKAMEGEVWQVPPKESAVKKVRRKRRVEYIKLLEMAEDGKRALFETEVEAGTYIRVLCADIGAKCGGAYMEELRRVAVGGIEEGEAVQFSALLRAKSREELEKLLKPAHHYIPFPKIWIKPSCLATVVSGAQIMAPGIVREEEVEKGQKVAIYCGEEFVGVGVYMREKGAKKGLAVKIERMHYRRGKNPLHGPAEI